MGGAAGATEAEAREAGLPRRSDTTTVERGALRTEYRGRSAGNEEPRGRKAESSKLKAEPSRFNRSARTKLRSLERSHFIGMVVCPGSESSSTIACHSAGSASNHTARFALPSESRRLTPASW